MIVSGFQRIEGRDFKHWGAVEGGLGFGNLWKAMWGLEFMHWLVTWEYWASYGCKSNQGHRAHGGGSSPQQSVGVWLSGWTGESQGWGSLVGCRLWGRTELDTTEATAVAVS